MQSEILRAVIVTAVVSKIGSIKRPSEYTSARESRFSATDAAYTRIRTISPIYTFILF